MVEKEIFLVEVSNSVCNITVYKSSNGSLAEIPKPIRKVSLPTSKLQVKIIDHFYMDYHVQKRTVVIASIDTNTFYASLLPDTLDENSTSYNIDMDIYAENLKTLFYN